MEVLTPQNHVTYLENKGGGGCVVSHISSKAFSCSAGQGSACFRPRWSFVLYTYMSVDVSLPEGAESVQNNIARLCEL